MINNLILIIKKTVTLFALVEPLAVIPIFLESVKSLTESEKIRFARTVGLSVTIALLIAAFLGTPLLALLGVSLGAMQVGGGVIVLLLAVAMVLGKESSFKGSTSVSVSDSSQTATIIPLAIPLLAGPAAFSYVMSHSVVTELDDIVSISLPILIVGAFCWATFHISCKAEKAVRKETLDLVERIGGFLLAAIAVEMMATGLRDLFPILAG